MISVAQSSPRGRREKNDQLISAHKKISNGPGLALIGSRKKIVVTVVNELRVIIIA